jgi:hypothetical protein
MLGKISSFLSNGFKEFKIRLSLAFTQSQTAEPQQSSEEQSSPHSGPLGQSSPNSGPLGESSPHSGPSSPSGPLGESSPHSGPSSPSGPSTGSGKSVSWADSYRSPTTRAMPVTSPTRGTQVRNPVIENAIKASNQALIEARQARQAREAILVAKSLETNLIIGATNDGQNPPNEKNFLSSASDLLSGTGADFSDLRAGMSALLNRLVVAPPSNKPQEGNPGQNSPTDGNVLNSVSNPFPRLNAISAYL